jgi:hypothetical protein
VKSSHIPARARNGPPPPGSGSPGSGAPVARMLRGACYGIGIGLISLVVLSAHEGRASRELGVAKPTDVPGGPVVAVARARACGVQRVASVVLPSRSGNAADRPDRAPCYASDMTEKEWQVVRASLPVPAWLQGRGGRLPEGYCHR